MILKSVLDNNYNVFGFIFDDNSFKDINELSSIKFENNEIKVCSDLVYEKNKFKIKNIPMMIKKGQDFLEIKNDIEVLKKIITNNKLSGFLININNEEVVLELNEFYKLSLWCNTLNYIVKKREDIFYICGKKGTKIETLPIYDYINERPTAYIKNLRTTINKNINMSNFRLDVINFFEYLDSKNITLLKLPENDYIQSKKSKEIDNKFIDLGIGELINPKIVYSDNKININMICKKMGNANIDGILYPVFDITSKHLFLNGANYLKEISIIIEKNKVKDLLEYLRLFDSDLLIKKYVNNSVINKIKSFLMKDNIEIYNINTKYLKISNENYDLSIYALFFKISDLFKYKTIMRYLNFIKKELDINPEKTRYGIYSKLNNSELLNLENNGIDIYSGILKRSNNEFIPTKENLSAEIIHSIKGYKSIPSGIDLKNKTKAKYISAELNDIINEIESELSIDEKIKKYFLYSKIYTNKIYDLTKDIWLYNISHLKNGKYIVNSLFWTKVEDGAYVCKMDGLNDFQLNLKNIKERS